MFDFVIDSSSSAPPDTPLFLGEVVAMRESNLKTLHARIVAVIEEMKRRSALSDALLARRLGRSEAEIAALLNGPDGWTFRIASDLLTAAGLEIRSFEVGPRSLRPVEC